MKIKELMEYFRERILAAGSDGREGSVAEVNTDKLARFVAVMSLSISALRKIKSDKDSEYSNPMLAEIALHEINDDQHQEDLGWSVFDGVDDFIGVDEFSPYDGQRQFAITDMPGFKRFLKDEHNSYLITEDELDVLSKETGVEVSFTHNGTMVTRKPRDFRNKAVKNAATGGAKTYILTKDTIELLCKRAGVEAEFNQLGVVKLSVPATAKDDEPKTPGVVRLRELSDALENLLLFGTDDVAANQHAIDTLKAVRNDFGWLK